MLLDGFGSKWADVRDAALAAEAHGFDGLWLNDHLSGWVQGASHVLECWTVLSALAAAVPRLAIGSLVLNVANRDAGTLAAMSATLQEVSGGRLLLGIGAGGPPGTPYALEQEALGRAVAKDPERRRAVEDTVQTLRQVWSGTNGFLRPNPPPPILIAALGSKMAGLAGRVGDGICVPAGTAVSRLVSVARDAHAQGERSSHPFLVVASLGSLPEQRGPWEELRVDRLVVYVAPPLTDRIQRLADILSRDSRT